MVTVPDVITAMRPIIAAIPNISACHYPAPKTINTPLEVVLYWGSPDGDTQISMDLDQRLWQPDISAQVMTPMKGNTPSEFARIDAILTPIVDAFDAGTTTQVMPSLRGAVHRCQIIRIDNRRLIEYNGNRYYGAELTFSVKFKRRAGG